MTQFLQLYAIRDGMQLGKLVAGTSHLVSPPLLPIGRRIVVAMRTGLLMRSRWKGVLWWMRAGWMLLRVWMVCRAVWMARRRSAKIYWGTLLLLLGWVLLWTMWLLLMSMVRWEVAGMLLSCIGLLRCSGSCNVSI